MLYDRDKQIKRVHKEDAVRKQKMKLRNRDNKSEMRDRLRERESAKKIAEKER